MCCNWNYTNSYAKTSPNETVWARWLQILLTIIKLQSASKLKLVWISCFVLFMPATWSLTVKPHFLRTGLSKYYQGRSESFTSLADVICVEDLAKKTTPYIRRPKASRRHAATLGVKNRLSKTVAKKEPRGRKLAASECQGKLYRC